MNIEWNTVGHDYIKSLFSKIEKTRRFSNAYLGIGPKGVGKSTLFREYVRNLTGKNFGEHPDLLLLDGENEGSMDTLRSFLASTRFASVELNNTFVLIDNVDSISTANMNIMLKTLEEPANGTVFFLVSHTYNIPKTIISRCIPLSFSRLNRLELNELAESKGIKVLPENILACQGSFSRLMQMVQDIKYEKIYLPAAKEMVSVLKKGLFERLILLNRLSMLEGEDIRCVIEITLGLLKEELVDVSSVERVRKMLEAIKRTQTNMNKKLILQGVLL